ncbi:hypothetical protein [Pseudacidovorax sp. 1753]|uniref:hypothetical protein n=1 Tax=Pseudacidovorax sp. 1753 TaxID=3156419 RepID=UPI003393A4A6
MLAAPKTVVLVENLQTGWALPEVRGAVAMLQSRGAASVLAPLPWLGCVMQRSCIGATPTPKVRHPRRCASGRVSTQSVLMDEAPPLSRRLR